MEITKEKHILMIHLLKGNEIRWQLKQSGRNLYKCLATVECMCVSFSPACLWILETPFWTGEDAGAETPMLPLSQWANWCARPALTPPPGLFLPALLCVKCAGGRCPPPFRFNGCQRHWIEGEQLERGSVWFRKQRERKHCTHHDAGTC